MTLTRKLEIEVPVDSRIADLVYFVKYLQKNPDKKVEEMTESDLVISAIAFWDMQHGEDD